MVTLKERDAFFDNARAALIFLVVFGHLIQPYTSEQPFLTALYLVIYSFHVPAFLFISGFFAKNIGREGYLEKVGKKLLGPYLIFYAFFSVYYFLTGKNSSVDLDLFSPVFALWFLLTLFSFNVILLVVRQFKPIYVLPAAIMIAIFSVFSTNIDGYLSWSRTLVFFPVFYIGYLLNDNFSHTIRQKKYVPLSIAVLVGFMIFYYFHPIDSSWLLASSPYQQIEGFDIILSPLKRLLFYVVIFTAMMAFLNLTPEKHYWFTYIGSRTMYVYLLHGIFIGLIRGQHIYPFIDAHPALGLLYNFILSCFIVWIWSTDFVAKWTSPFVQLKSPATFKPYK
ncbi:MULTISPECIES: acyltransferase family protein [unclassified Staphylococcus]|uniref:acyltransferase family protein n=1 Tax=unclassified Staphylococcus TaxID=91994 RepID=UPI0021CF4006|nr:MULTISPECIES: acyltransferase family protein [unclassified Staphylococcus]UXR76912.1 acyltransferase family protein [Staphylococcus sp. IVB6233]UXR81038.1 acyltransferase family protein [Staphylococcus sp. IVB6218]